jgi:hypothetical protein
VRSATHEVWHSMMMRCYNTANKDYPRYGGRGIKVCNTWLTYENFLNDMGERPDGMTLDRVYNDSDYGPANCRWASRQDQARNRSTTKLKFNDAVAIVNMHFVEGKSHQKIADTYGVDKSLIGLICRGLRWEGALDHIVEAKETTDGIG